MTVTKTSITDRLNQLAVALFLAILVLVPFQALIVAWLGSHIGHLDAIRIWKDVLLFGLLGICLWLLLEDKSLRQKVLRNKIFWVLVAAYVLLHLALAVWALETNKVTVSALFYGLIINLRLPAVFAAGYILTTSHPDLKKTWRSYLLAPAVVIVIFGFLQSTVLSADILRHVGYGPNTIPAFQTVDLKPDFVRVQSTLRGPNPLGAYLVLIITALTGVLSFTKKRSRGIFWLVITALALEVLFFSYSRSAWVGTGLSVAFVLFAAIEGLKKRATLIVGIVVLVVVGAGLVVGLRHSKLFENTVFHTDSTSASPISSNEARAAAWHQGIEIVKRRPFGNGPGTAGPASTRNNQNVQLSENYYLQIAEEVGLLGLAIFVAMNLLIAYQLWLKREERLALVLLASLIGITFINLVSHAWADDTLAYLWWGLAGIALAPAILKTNSNAYAQKKTTARS